MTPLFFLPIPPPKKKERKETDGLHKSHTPQQNKNLKKKKKQEAALSKFKVTFCPNIGKIKSIRLIGLCYFLVA